MDHGDRDHADRRAAVSSTLLGSKLHPPGLRSGIMPRQRLAEAAAGCGASVVLVVAPPGFGKPMLLAQWEALDDRPFAWVSLDRRDNDPLVLWNYVVAANSQSPKSTDAHSFRITVRGALTQAFLEPVGPVSVETTGDETVLRCVNADQARLQAVLGWLYVRSIEIVNVASEDDGGSSTEGRSTQ
jgi:hypothetical protein